jgi:succinate dehydrogenase flavin-adding protein (antitoxin of CptAB toxin-antitoxin module)
MLRDGIEDYEYLAILSRLLKAKEDKLTPQQRKKYTALLEVPESITKDMTTFTKDPAPIEARRDRIARAIAKLNRL